MRKNESPGFEIVAERFGAAEFESYLRELEFRDWIPKFAVLHHTGVPSMAQRPKGFTPQQIENLRTYYAGLGWSGGPHLFIDQNGIWVFNPLDRAGVHSPTWNGDSWGVEMLGNYDAESFSSKSGKAILENTLAALAALHIRMNLNPSSLRFHREDPKTSHRSCPGKHVEKAFIQSSVDERIASIVSDGELILRRKNRKSELKLPVRIYDGRAYADAAALAKASGRKRTEFGPILVRKFLQMDFRLQWESTTRTVFAEEYSQD